MPLALCFNLIITAAYLSQYIYLLKDIRINQIF